MHVRSVTIENFLSIEKARVVFDDVGLLLIEGYNYDVDRANGAGKTAILNALSFALYERIPRKVTATELLRRGATKGQVTVEVSCNTDTFTVVRSRPKGVKFYRHENEESVELALTQAEWEGRLGLSYGQFIVSMYCSQANSSVAPRFLLLNDTDKKQFLLELLNLDEFALCKQLVDKKIQQLQTEASDIENNIKTLQAKIDAFSESVVNDAVVKSALIEKEASREHLLSALREQEAVARPDLTKFQKLEDDIAVKKTEFVKARARREMLMSQWTNLGRKIRPFSMSDACPTCGTALDNTHARSVHDVEMVRLQGEQTSIKGLIDAIDTALLNETKINDLELKVRERKRIESSAYERASAQRQDLTIKIGTVDVLIKDLNQRLGDNASLVAKVRLVQEQQRALRERVVVLAQEIEVQKTVSHVYSPTGAQAYVLDSAVALFNEQVVKHVSALWPNLTYELQSYKETVKGDVTAKFSESIVMDGRPISLGSLSGGELRAMSICADMALLGLLEQQFGIHMSPVIFDEAFDGLDASGKEFALDLIKGLAQDRQVVVIDHASEMRSSFDKVLRVEKRSGISTVSASS